MNVVIIHLTETDAGDLSDLIVHGSER
jgi:hypothetical protein